MLNELQCISGIVTRTKTNTVLRRINETHLQKASQEYCLLAIPPG